jgi:hypothetical protein
MTAIRFLAATAVSILLCGTADAVTFNEGVDLSAPGENAGVLDLGLNSFAGTLGGTCLQTGASDFPCGGTGDLFDQVRFDVANGHEIVSGSIFRDFGAPSPAVFLNGQMGPTGSLGSSYNAQTNGTSAPFLFIGTGLPDFNAGEGTYFLNLFASPGADAAGAEDQFAGSWRVELQVRSIAPIPLPAGGLLLLSALTTGAAVSRRRRG